MAAVRAGASMRATARRFRVSLATVQCWVSRAQGRRLDRVDWNDRPAGPKRACRASRDVEELVLAIRAYLRDVSDLGNFGAKAIHREMLQQQLAPIPSVRTIGRILARNGALDGRKRVRRPPPPAGWYLPSLAKRAIELDSFDVIEGLTLQGGPGVEVLTAISLHGGLVDAWPTVEPVNTDFILDALVHRWRGCGRPAYAQFDNDTIFAGPHSHPDVLGRVVRLCLSLGVTPVFAPPREMGFQAAIESFNGRWQAKVWQRFHFPSLDALVRQSARYSDAAQKASDARREAAPPRRPFPKRWRRDLATWPKGTIVFIRRTREDGSISILGRSVPVAVHWAHRLVRAELDLDQHLLHVHALRRKNPADQPLLTQLPHRLKTEPPT